MLGCWLHSSWVSLSFYCIRARPHYKCTKKNHTGVNQDLHHLDKKKHEPISCRTGRWGKNRNLNRSVEFCFSRFPTCCRRRKLGRSAREKLGVRDEATTCPRERVLDTITRSHFLHNIISSLSDFVLNSHLLLLKESNDHSQTLAVNINSGNVWMNARTEWIDGMTNTTSRASVGWRAEQWKRKDECGGERDARGRHTQSYFAAISNTDHCLSTQSQLQEGDEVSVWVQFILKLFLNNSLCFLYVSPIYSDSHSELISVCQ